MLQFYERSLSRGYLRCSVAWIAAYERRTSHADLRAAGPTRPAYVSKCIVDFARGKSIDPMSIWTILEVRCSLYRGAGQVYIFFAETLISIGLGTRFY